MDSFDSWIMKHGNILNESFAFISKNIPKFQLKTHLYFIVMIMPPFDHRKHLIFAPSNEKLSSDLKENLLTESKTLSFSAMGAMYIITQTISEYRRSLLPFN